MAIEDDLLAAIQSSLGPALNPNLTAASKTWDLYEAYVLSIVLDAARDLGAVIAFYNMQGPTNEFVFRTSPGYIFSTAQPYTFARIELSNVPAVEAHVGVKVAGVSGVLNECDVLVLDAAEAETCRRNSVHPRSYKVVFSAECKFYTDGLPLSVARSFLGLGVDIGAKHNHFVANITSESIEKMLAHHRHGMWEHELTPQAASVVSRLRDVFQNEFKNFVARKR